MGRRNCRSLHIAVGSGGLSQLRASKGSANGSSGLRRPTETRIVLRRLLTISEQGVAESVPWRSEPRFVVSPFELKSRFSGGIPSSSQSRDRGSGISIRRHQSGSQKPESKQPDSLVEKPLADTGPARSQAASLLIITCSCFENGSDLTDLRGAPLQQPPYPGEPNGIDSSFPQAQAVKKSCQGGDA